MLLHDRRLLRTTGVPARLESLSSRQVQRLRVRGGGRIPTFAQALEAIGSRMRIAVDVKDAGAADSVISEMRNQHKELQVLFWSQHEPAVRAAVKAAPELAVSLLRDTKTPDELDQFLDDARRFGATGISAHWSQVAPALAERCSAAGMALDAWCKRERIEPDRLALLTGVVTDWPQAARSAISMRDALE